MIPDMLPLLSCLRSSNRIRLLIGVIGLCSIYYLAIWFKFTFPPESLPVELIDSKVRLISGRSAL